MRNVIFLKGDDMDARREYSMQWVNEGSDRIRICHEDVVASCGTRFFVEHDAVAMAACLNMLINSLRKNMDVVIDGENLNRARFQRMETVARQHHANIVWREFPVDGKK